MGNLCGGAPSSQGRGADGANIAGAGIPKPKIEIDNK